MNKVPIAVNSHVTPLTGSKQVAIAALQPRQQGVAKLGGVQLSSQRTTQMSMSMGGSVSSASQKKDGFIGVANQLSTPRTSNVKMMMGSGMPSTSSSGFGSSSFTASNDLSSRAKMGGFARNEPTMLAGGLNSFTIKGAGMSVQKNHFDSSFSRSKVVMSAATAEEFKTAKGTTFEKAVQKPLPYPMNGLEPVISENLMNYHYGKHHVAYVNNVNGLMEKAAQALEDGDQQAYIDFS